MTEDVVKLEDAELLDAVRRVRSYMITIDNVHHVLTKLQLMDDKVIVDQSMSLLGDAPDLNMRISLLLRSVESSKQYRAMIRKFNINEEEEN